MCECFTYLEREANNGKGEGYDTKSMREGIYDREEYTYTYILYIRTYKITKVKNEKSKWNERERKRDTII